MKELETRNLVGTWLYVADFSWVGPAILFVESIFSCVLLFWLILRYFVLFLFCFNKKSRGFSTPVNLHFLVFCGGEGLFCFAAVVVVVVILIVVARFQLRGC